MAGMIGKTAFAVLALGASVLSSAFSAEAASRYMRTGAITSQPIGHYQFCQTNKADCSVVSATVTPARVTDFGWNVIKEVNAEVNRRILPMTDQDIYGRDEVWAYPTDVGDCEDFVLEKRRELMKRGFAASNLLITVVRKPDGEGHAVLTVKTSLGDYVLDNLEARILPWNETEYTYLKRQSETNSGVWVKINDGRAEAVASVR